MYSSALNSQISIWDKTWSGQDWWSPGHGDSLAVRSGLFRYRSAVGIWVWAWVAAYLHRPSRCCPLCRLAISIKLGPFSAWMLHKMWSDCYCLLWTVDNQNCVFIHMIYTHSRTGQTHAWIDSLPSFLNPVLIFSPSQCNRTWYSVFLIGLGAGREQRPGLDGGPQGLGCETHFRHLQF